MYVLYFTYYKKNVKEAHVKHMIKDMPTVTKHFQKLKQEIKKIISNRLKKYGFEDDFIITDIYVKFGKNFIVHIKIPYLETNETIDKLQFISYKIPRAKYSYYKQIL